MKLLFLCALLIAHTLAASITPVTENPIPSWASEKDICSPIRSCDSCSTSQYCKYIQSSAYCCETRIASIKPIVENPIPSWASDKDVCVTHRSCDDCNDNQYCKYTQNNNGVVAQCCSSTQHKYDASITPITTPLPSWASKSDVCTKIQSCDDCTTSDSTYCKYTKRGNAKCCSRSGVVPSTPTASITPIVENPIPSWASDKDICTVRRSCDDCSTDQYCKYITTTLGKVQSQCCSNPNTKKQYVASITPIINQLPSWASKSDVCSKVRSCDDCTTGMDSYCKYTKRGNAKCCTRSGTSPKPSDTPASITPIVENPIPSWASDKDVCVRKRSCDSCLESQYCKYTSSGRPSCCSAPGSVVPKSNGGEASITPITENPIPSWASDKDICVTERSCDNCSSEQYCKYNSNGQPSCCGRASNTPATVQPIKDNPIPSWASNNDMCLQIRSCDDCQGHSKYCKYNNAGKPQCCTKLL